MREKDLLQSILGKKGYRQLLRSRRPKASMLGLGIPWEKVVDIVEMSGFCVGATIIGALPYLFILLFFGGFFSP